MTDARIYVARAWSDAVDVCANTPTASRSRSPLSPTPRTRVELLERGAAVSAGSTWLGVAGLFPSPIPAV